MDSTDRWKLLKGGFRLFRMRREGEGKSLRYSIWELSPKGSWIKASDHATQRELKEAWRELMADDKHIGDTEEGDGK